MSVCECVSERESTTMTKPSVLRCYDLMCCFYLHICFRSIYCLIAEDKFVSLTQLSIFNLLLSIIIVVVAAPAGDGWCSLVHF